jgi:hypothetical protein
VALHRRRRNGEEIRGGLDRKASKKTQLDDAPLLRASFVRCSSASSSASKSISRLPDAAIASSKTSVFRVPPLFAALRVRA